MKLLFECSQNRFRSPTAETVFSAYPWVEAKSAGTNRDADTPISEDLIEWADVVLVMEKSHRNKLTRKFKSAFRTKRLVVLDILDEYMDMELVRILQARVPRYVRII